MKAAFRLEAIADNWHDARLRLETGQMRHPPRWRDHLDAIRYGQKRLCPWVARVIDIRADGSIEREFVHGTKDYSRADSIGSRGVYIYYVLDPGVYEVNERIDLLRARRWFGRVADGVLSQITKQEAIECLNAISE